jgi:hypothetical protein
MTDIDADHIPGNKLLCDPGDLEALATELEQASISLPRQINANPEGVERGLT